MLTEQRFDMILKLLDEKKTITVTELKELLNTSESTIRRDLNALDQAGKLVKVFGGAVAVHMSFTSEEPSVAQKLEVKMEEKRAIGRYAASLIQADDFVYLDAGTSTSYMIDYITEKKATFITNAVDHARRLAAAGFRVVLIGGELKGTTEAVVGNQAIVNLQSYHFSKGFFGANGVSREAGYTTPDYNEALVKKTALESCRQSYLLCDSSKFGHVSSVTFAPADASVILTDKKPGGGFEDCRIELCPAYQ